MTWGLIWVSAIASDASGEKNPKCDEREKKHTRMIRMNESNKCIKWMIVQLFWPHHNFQMCASTRHLLTHSYISDASFATTMMMMMTMCEFILRSIFMAFRVNFFSSETWNIIVQKLKHCFVGCFLLFQLLKIISSFCFFLCVSSFMALSSSVDCCIHSHTQTHRVFFAVHRDTERTTNRPTVCYNVMGSIISAHCVHRLPFQFVNISSSLCKLLIKFMHELILCYGRRIHTESLTHWLRVSIVMPWLISRAPCIDLLEILN